MPNFQLGDTEQAAYTLTELDGASQPVMGDPTDVISITVAPPSAATIVPDATPVAGSVASGQVLGGVPTVGAIITAKVTHADGTSLSTTDTIDVVGGTATSISFGLGAPVVKQPAAMKK